MLRFKQPDGALPNLLALAYAFGGYGGGLALIALGGPAGWIPGTLLLGHAMIIAAYLLHECAHNTLFPTNEANARLGRWLGWLASSCYGTYESIRHKHFRHHVDRADVVAFDYRPPLARYPGLVRFMEALEWCYIPALDIMMHALVLILPFTMESRKHLRSHVLKVFFIRASLFGALIWYAPVVAICYPIAWTLMVTVLRFMDAFQHTYEIDDTLETPVKGKPRFDAAYEHRNTFTNLHSTRYPLLNLLTLNFGYHNAHHEKPTEPWFRLPVLHKKLYGEDCGQALPIWNQLKAFHRYRTQRMLNADEGDLDVLSDKGAHFVGVDGVSFLTAH
jgi:fatty acid desaturase